MSIHLRRIALCCLVALLILTWVTPTRSAAPRTSSDPMAIIAAVNALRATQGLPPYVVDQGLMAYALEHSRYQASLHTATHQHSDGTTVWQHGMDENIAEGMLGFLTPEYAVYTIWSDAIHMKTMIGYATGSVGAGVSDDGADEYYTLDVRPGNPVSKPGKSGPVDPNATPTKIIPIVPLLTVTPRPDRWQIHTVGYGQSLWAVAIAYGVKMDQIRDWNSMARESVEIYAGQKLYIIAPTQIWANPTKTPPGQAAGTQTVTPGAALTEDPQALLEKAAYQTAAAQTQAPPSEGQVAQGTEPPPEAAVAGASSLTMTPAPGVQASASPGGGQTPDGNQSPGVDQALVPVTKAPSENEADGGNLPMVAGILILAGGGLLLVITFSMLRRK